MSNTTYVPRQLPSGTPTWLIQAIERDVQFLNEANALRRAWGLPPLVVLNPLAQITPRAITDGREHRIA